MKRIFFHDNQYYRLLKKLIMKSKDIPAEYKRMAISYLRRENVSTDFLGDGKNYKFLFATSMFYRAYDIYTTSLLAYILRNRSSLFALLRCQFENMCKIAYYIEHPDELKYAFKREVKIKKIRRSLANFYEKEGFQDNFNSDYFKKVYERLSNIVHPFPEGLRIYYDDLYMLVMGKENVLYPLLFRPTFRLMPHHAEFSDNDKEGLMEVIVGFFSEVIRLLKRLCEMNIKDEIPDYSELHKKTSIHRSMYAMVSE